jgi:hypothetical protein
MVQRAMQLSLIARPHTLQPDILMSSMHRTISGDIIVQHLGSDALMIDPILLAQRGRSARTLVKEGALRLTLMGLAAGGILPPHSTDNPVSIHVLDGDVMFYGGAPRPLT